MKKFIYKINKPFSIYEDEKGNMSIAETDEQKKAGTSFASTAKYVDYEDDDKKAIEQTKITEELKQEGYIELKTKKDFPKSKKSKS